MFNPRNMMRCVGQLTARFPLTLSAIFIGGSYFAGDSITQYYEGRHASMSWDWSRSFVFTSFGVWVGLSYGWALLKTYPWLMRQLNCHRSISGPVVEGSYYFPVLYFPGFYVLQDIRSSGRITLVSAYQRYKKNIFQDMLNWLKFWPLPVAVGFASLPNHMIPVYISIVGFIWVLILSSTRGELYNEELDAFDIDGSQRDLWSNVQRKN